MASRPTVFAAGLLYHVIVRGNQRRKTFRFDDNYKAYLGRFEKYRAQCATIETASGEKLKECNEYYDPISDNEVLVGAL